MKVFDVLFPPKCPVCGRLADSELEICSDCFAAYESEARRSGGSELRLPLDGREEPLVCIYSGSYFASRTRVTEKLLFAMKQRSDRSAVRFFARVLAHDIVKYLISHCDDARTYIVTYAPRSHINREKYGFDHAERMARVVAKYTGARFMHCFVRRGGEEQKLLGRRERAENAETICMKKGARIAGAKVIVIDDLITSGATLKRCAAELYNCGAATVIAATALCRKRSERVR